MAKKRVSEVNKKEDAIREAFWKDIREVEAKHSMALKAFIDYSQYAILPVIGAKIVEKKEE